MEKKSSETHPLLLLTKRLPLLPNELGPLSHRDVLEVAAGLPVQVELYVSGDAALDCALVVDRWVFGPVVLLAVLFPA